MKVYNLSGFTGTRHRNIEHHNSVQGQRKFLRRASGGEDMVDISPEAMRKYSEHKTVELEAARIKKLTAQVLDIIHREHDAPVARNTGETGTGMVREIMIHGNGDIDEEVHLREAAENLLGFFIS